MTHTEVIIGLLSLIGFFGPLLIFGILKLTKRNLDNHEIIYCFLTLVAFISGIILMLWLIIAPVSAISREREATESAKVEAVLKDANLSELQDYFVNKLGADDIAYNKETKKVIIDTNESSQVNEIAAIDKELAKNDKIKSVEFTRAGGKGGLIILIINLK